MSNIATLTNAGLIVANTTFSSDDQNAIESLTSDEVNALISISQKIGRSRLFQPELRRGNACSLVHDASGWNCVLELLASFRRSVWVP